MMMDAEVKRAWMRRVLAVDIPDFGGAAAEAVGSAGYTSLLLRWHATQRRVEANLRALGLALLDDPEIVGDPDFPEIRDAIESLPDILPDFGSQLDDILDLMRAPTADRKTLSRQAMVVLSRYRSRLDSVSALRELERFSSETSLGSILLFEDLGRLLDELEATLGSAG